MSSLSAAEFGGRDRLRSSCMPPHASRAASAGVSTRYDRAKGVLRITFPDGQAKEFEVTIVTSGSGGDRKLGAGESNTRLLRAIEGLVQESLDSVIRTDPSKSTSLSSYESFQIAPDKVSGKQPGKTAEEELLNSAQAQNAGIQKKIGEVSRALTSASSSPVRTRLPSSGESVRLGARRETSLRLDDDEDSGERGDADRKSHFSRRLPPLSRSYLSYSDVDEPVRYPHSNHSSSGRGVGRRSRGRSRRRQRNCVGYSSQSHSSYHSSPLLSSSPQPSPRVSRRSSRSPSSHSALGSDRPAH